MTVDPPNERDETWFGSGLRAHLGIKPDEVESRPAAETPAERQVEKVTVPEAPALDERLAERARMLREAELKLAERERALSEQAEQIVRERGELERRVAELNARAADVETRAADVAAAERQLPVRTTLRDRAEGETDRLWRTIDDALEATFEDGRPDFHARLAAIKLLLGEAYDGASAAEALPGRDEPHDELALRRAERFQP